MMQKVGQKQVGNAAKYMRIEVYLASGIGMVGMAATSDAGVVTINLSQAGSGQVDIRGFNGGIGTPPDMQGGSKLVPGLISPTGPGDLALYAWGYLGNLYRAGFVGSNGLSFAVLGGDANPEVFRTDDPIGPSATWSDVASETVFNWSVDEYKKASFGNGTGGYFIGFRSNNGTDSFYGWLEVEWNNSAGYGGVFQILRGAYENTPNTLILAGDTGGGGAVPEPASGAIAAMLMGGAALRQWRKKRRQAA